MFASIAYDVHPTQESNGREHCVRTVEQCHLAGMVGLLIVGNDHMKSGFVGGKLFSQLFRAHVFSLFDDSQMKTLGFNHEVVFCSKPSVGFH